MPLSGLDKAKNDTEQRGLADTRFAHDGGLGADLEVVAKMVQNLSVALGITE